MPLITTTVDVTAGQTSTGDTVVTPGRFQVFSGGAISETAVVDGGSVLIYSGGTATATTLPGRRLPGGLWSWRGHDGG